MPLTAGGRAFGHHNERLPLEARPGLLGTPGLVYFWVTYWRPLALDPGLKPQSADHLRQGDTVGQGSGNVPADVRRRQIRKADWRACRLSENGM